EPGPTERMLPVQVRARAVGQPSVDPGDLLSVALARGRGPDHPLVSHLAWRLSGELLQNLAGFIPAVPVVEQRSQGISQLGVALLLRGGPRLYPANPPLEDSSGWLPIPMSAQVFPDVP